MGMYWICCWATSGKSTTLAALGDSTSISSAGMVMPSLKRYHTEEGHVSDISTKRGGRSSWQQRKEVVPPSWIAWRQPQHGQ